MLALKKESERLEKEIQRVKGIANEQLARETRSRKEVQTMIDETKAKLPFDLRKEDGELPFGGLSFDEPFGDDYIL